VSEGRAAGLDGLRGAAAVTVALGHFFFLFPQNNWTVVWKYSPLYVLVAGREAVVVFFVLSGFALYRMMERQGGRSYGPFAVRRIVRIYGPYLAALGLAVAGNFWLSQGSRAGFSEWFNQEWPIPLRTNEVVRHVLFLGDYNTAVFNGAFWSLVHEMRISLVFPLLYVLMEIRAIRKRAVWGIGIAVATIVAGSFLGAWVGQPNNIGETVHYAGLFIAGIVIAQRPGLGVSRVWLCCGLVLFYYGRGVSRLVPLPYANLLDLPVGAGALILVRWALRSRWMMAAAAQWMGRRSFSLYLMHVPVLLALVNVLNLQKPHFALIFLYVPFTVLLTEGFYRAVERPMLNLSRSVKKKSADLIR
jgi:peptidoglycan/LPS O-acetylase OafA/YrhL